MNYFSEGKKQWDMITHAQSKYKKNPLNKPGSFFSILPLLSSCREISATEERIHMPAHENRPLHYPPPTLSPDWSVSHKGRAVCALCTLTSPEGSPGPDPEQELKEGKAST